MKKQILALAVVGALGVSSVTVASPSSAPAVAAEAQLGAVGGPSGRPRTPTARRQRPAC